MCYNFNNKGVSLKKALQQFDAEVSEDQLTFIGDINAFTKSPQPFIPAIVNNNGIIIQNTFWGVQETPNAPTKGKNLKSENTLTFYKKIQHNRCVIPATSYYEHQTVSVEGRKTPLKIKHELFWENHEQFYIAAFYDFYKDGNIGFGLVTTEPNPIEAIIHNRMIITLDSITAIKFLQNTPIEEFQFPNYSPKLSFTNLEPNKVPPTLF